MTVTIIDEILNLKLSKMNNLEELTSLEYLEIFGGKPTTDTSLFYDVGWWVGTGIREVESWFE